MYEVEGIGKNIEQAIDNALFELKAVRDDVDIKILDEGGIFRKAKVLVSISLEEREKYAKRAQERNIVTKEPEIEPETKVVFKDELAPEKTEKQIEVKELPKQEKHEEVSNEQPIKEIYNHEGELNNCLKFVRGLLETANVIAEVKATEDDEDIYIVIDGVSAESLIGYRGETLNALQYLVSTFNSKDNRHAKRVRVDVNNYREKREQTLIALANRIANKVLKTGHSCKLEPMTPNERRIIHTALQNNDKITTFSKGEEPKRFLIVALKND